MTGVQTCALPISQTIQTLSQTLSVGSYTFLVNSSTGVQSGQIVIGNGFSVGTQVVSVVGNSITVTKPIAQSGTNVSITFYPQASLGMDYLWQIIGQQIDPDGYTNPSSVRVTMWQSNSIGIPDNPNEYNMVVNPSNTADLLLFWVNVTSSDGYQYWQPVQLSLSQIFQDISQVPAIIVQPSNTVNSYWTNGKIVYVMNQGKMLQYQTTSITVPGNLVDVTSNYKVRIGRNNLSFLWVHYAPTDQRINPAVTNVIDMYVLTTSYDTALRNWIATNGSLQTLPVPETSAQLAANFSNLDQYAMMTDQMVWHAVSYVLLFGSQAPAELQADFVVVPVPGTTFTNNQIQSLVIQYINQYFALRNWDFGDSFFFTEMAAYIHQNLATIVGSIVMRPVSSQAVFGDLFEIQVGPDQIPISCATVNNIQIVQSLTDSVLGITNSNG